MGRHASDKNKYAVSGVLIAEILVVIALSIIVASWFFGFRNSNDAGDSAATGGRDCTVVPVAAADRAIVETALASDTATEGCVDTELVDDIADAIIYVGPDSPVVDRTLADAQRTESGDTQAVASVAVGLGGTAAAVIGDVQPGDVSFDTTTQPEAAVLVANALGIDDLNTTDGEFAATAENQVADGEIFSAIDGAELVHFAHVLAPTEELSDEQHAAATSVAAAWAETYDGPATSPEAPEELWEAAMADPSAAPEAANQAAELAQNTLFLLDTSSALAPFQQSAAAAIGDAAVAATDAGTRVALWNYSSPLNPGVTQGWRSNVDFTDVGEDVRTSVQLFGVGGEPQTHSALQAAVAYAQTAGGAARIVLITTGTIDSEVALPTLGDGVELSVIHVGDGSVDADLAGLASTTAQVNDPTMLGDAVRAATGL